MTQAEAIEAMKDGKKVHHMRFKESEWITMENGNIVTESGQAYKPFDYWKQRKLSHFQDYWYIYNEGQ